MRDTDRPIVIAPAVARVEPQRCLDLLDRQIELSRPDTESASQKPSPREAWIQCESTIHQFYLSADILAEKG